MDSQDEVYPMELRPIKHSEYDPANQNGGGAVTKNKDLVTYLHVCHAQNPEIKIVKPATRKTLSANTLS